jgi:putative hemin transport protein
MKPTTHFIRQSFIALRKEGKLRHREIASSLKISEAELIAAHIGQESGAHTQLWAIRLTHAWAEIIQALEPIGDLMALTRNEACVHEKIGQYKNASQDGMMGVLLGEIDLRIFYHQWYVGFAVIERTEHGEQRSIQFFNAHGLALHKVYLKPQSNVSAYDNLIRLFATKHQQPGIEIQEPKAVLLIKPDQQIDVIGFRQAWRDLKDTHDFYPLLRQYGVTRTQALRLAEPNFVNEVTKESIKSLLEKLSASQIPVMIFVSNPGIIQIHTGTIINISEQGVWINVMDLRFNLHLRQDFIKNAWVVRKPTVDGIVTSMELYDHSGEVIAMFFGERKPGKPELQKWRDLIAEIEGAESVEGAHS